MVVLYLKIELKSKKSSMHYALMIKLFLKKINPSNFSNTQITKKSRIPHFILS